MLTTHRFHRTTVACALALALAAPAASSAQDDSVAWTPPRQDLRSPDTRDAATGIGTSKAFDVASPIFTDRQRAMVERYKSSPSYEQALREAATVGSQPSQPRPSQPIPVRSDEGIDWGDAGIGAGTLFAVFAIGLGGALAIVRRRRRGSGTATA